MPTLGIFRNDRDSQQRRELENVSEKAAKLKSSEIPQFSFGLEELGLDSKGDQRKTLEDFVMKWFESPSTFLNLEKFSAGAVLPNVSSKIEEGENSFSFNSLLNDKDTAKFFESKQPFYGNGEKIAFIILPHWNSFFDKYKAGTTIIRGVFLPVATYRYFPSYETEKDFIGKPRYDIVGPNLGLTIRRFWQDVLNIQRFAKYLKESLGYEKVGIWAYSIGSPRGYIASMFSENLFDYLIMNSLADSFPQALLHGIGTTLISKEVLKNLSEEEVEKLLSPLSPGHYAEYMKNLPKYTRLVQGRYDLVFGEVNNKLMVDNFNKYAPFAEVEYGDFGHTTSGELEKVFPIVYRNSKFVFKNSKLKYFGL